MSVSFGDLVRRGREEAGLSQARLALLIGKSPTTVRAWEHGRTHPADPGAVAALAAVLGLDEVELLGQAGFEAPAAPTRPSARQELNNLATERTEMIALAPFAVAPSSAKAVKPAISNPDLVDSPVTTKPATMDPVDVEPGSNPEAEGDVKPVTTVPIEIPATPVEVSKPKVRKPVVATRIRKPEPRVIVAQPAAPGPGPVGVHGQVGSNGYIPGRSYVEDEAEQDFYRRRGLITALVLVFMVIVIWWALGRTGGAIGELIESFVGLLDI